MQEHTKHSLAFYSIVYEVVLLKSSLLKVVKSKVWNIPTLFALLQVHSSLRISFPRVCVHSGLPLHSCKGSQRQSLERVSGITALCFCLHRRYSRLLLTNIKTLLSNFHSFQISVPRLLSVNQVFFHWSSCCLFGLLSPKTSKLLPSVGKFSWVPL